MPEDELVRTRVYPPDGKQPTTATPKVELQPLSGGRARLAATCETEGASVGFRMAQANQKAQGPWTIYTGPVELHVTGPIEVVTHRIGFKRSLPVQVENLPK
jgi:hypothetical protein